MGILIVTMDTLFQRIRAVHLPSRLPITSLSHLTCIITGATSGIGLETARELAKSGAHVVLAVRNTAAAKELVEQWRSTQAGAAALNVEVIELDLLSLDSVRTFGESWEARKVALNVLINNAGIFSMKGEQKFSKDGNELHMQVNHLAPALLTVLLLPSLLRGAPSRVLMVNSLMHYLGFVDPEDLNIKSGKRKYKNMSGYSDSKLAQVMFCNMLQRRLPMEAVLDVITLHPGEVHSNMTRDLPTFVQRAKDQLFFLFTAPEGARSVLFCATDRQVQNYARTLRSLGYHVAPYFSSDCKPRAMARQVQDIEKAQKVWQETLKLVGLPQDCIEQILAGPEPVEATEPIEVIKPLEVYDSFADDGNEGAVDFLSEDPTDLAAQ